jgi:protein phosphatase
LTITVPALSLLVLIGASSSGKSTFAGKHFLATEVISSDASRAVLADNENAMEVSREAFDLVHTIAATRLRRGRIAVIDATNLQHDARAHLLGIALDNQVPAIAIVFDLPLGLLQHRSAQRSDRALHPRVLRNQHNLLKQYLPDLQHEGFSAVYVLRSVDEVDAAVVERQRR